MADAFSDVLIERNRVAETSAARMRRGGEEAVIGGMAAIDIGMGNAAENGEIVAMLAEQFEVRRKLVIGAGIFREEMFREQAEIVTDAEHAARLAAGSLVGSPLNDGGKSGTHSIE
jgi:hypothetical protein